MFTMIQYEGEEIPEHLVVTQIFTDKAWHVDIHTPATLAEDLIHGLFSDFNADRFVFSYELKKSIVDRAWLCFRVTFPYRKLRKHHYFNQSIEMKTLSLILGFLVYIEQSKIPEAAQRQSLYIGTAISDPDRDWHPGGQSLWIECSPAAANQLQTLYADEAKREDLAMIITTDMVWLHSKIFGVRSTRKVADFRKPVSWFDIYGWLNQSGTVSLHTTGNCVCLGCEPRRNTNEGFLASGHNIDSWSQQLVILSGLIRIGQLVREIH